MQSWQAWHDTFPVALDLLLLSVVALGGIGLGRLSIGGLRLGVAGVLFSGLIASHFGFRPDHGVAHFIKEFGLMLFVFSLGLQMGPGFFASLRKEGLRLNLYAAAIIGGGALITLAGARLLGLPMAAAAGVFAGATTNTPALGAAQQALASGAGDEPALAAMAYAAAYSLGVVGIIGSLMLLRSIFRVDLREESDRLRESQREGSAPLERMNLVLENPNLDGVEVIDVPGLRETGVVVSRVRRRDETEAVTAGPHTVLHLGDTFVAVGTRAHLEQFRLVVGRESGD